MSSDFTALMQAMQAYLVAHAADWGNGIVTINATESQQGTVGLNLSGNYTPTDIDGEYAGIVNIEINDRRTESPNNTGIDVTADAVVWLLGEWLGRGNHPLYMFHERLPQAGGTTMVMEGENKWLKKTMTTRILFTRQSATVSFPS